MSIITPLIAVKRDLKTTHACDLFVLLRSQPVVRAMYVRYGKTDVDSSGLHWLMGIRNARSLLEATSDARRHFAAGCAVDALPHHRFWAGRVNASMYAPSQVKRILLEAAAHGACGGGYPISVPAIDWRLVLSHPDYSARIPPMRALGRHSPWHQFRYALSIASRSEDSEQFDEDGSKFFFVDRTYGVRFTGQADYRIVWQGEAARALVTRLQLPSRCRLCEEKAEACNCQWGLVNGVRTWVRARPDVVEGQSALEYRNESVMMKGKQGRAVGVEIELFTVGRPEVQELHRYCMLHDITRKSDGSTGVTIELATSPMREEFYESVLAGLHDRLVTSMASPSAGCGVHIHVDATSFDAFDVGRLLALWRKYGGDIWDMMPDGRHGNQYCANTSGDPEPTSIELYGTTLLVEGRQERRHDRYVDVNLENLRNGRKTIEFRLFPAYHEDYGLSPEEDPSEDVPLIRKEMLLAYVNVSRQLVETAESWTPENEAALVRQVERMAHIRAGRL